MYRTIRKFISKLSPAKSKADTSAESRDEFPQDSIMYSLDHPPYHLIQLGEVNSFSGWAFHHGGKTINTLRVYADTAFVDEFPADRRRDDVAGYFGHIPDARRCGFDFRLYIDPAVSNYEIQFVFGDGSTEGFITYDLREIRALQHTLNKMKSTVDKIPVPDGDLVYATLGHRDSEVYKNSIIPCVVNIMKYLRYCGVDPYRIRSILDFGCGSGRTLIGWYSDNPDRNLCGCDINGELISWGRKNLPARIELQHTPLLPPLPYPEDSFDFIHLISVFTHLSLQSQKRWISEFKRILKPGGHLLMTLHGGIYVNIFCPEKIAEFTEDGYVERASPGEGSNDYAAFHAYGFAKDLFNGFAMSGYFPNGRIDDKRILFPLAGAQDVYLLQLK